MTTDVELMTAIVIDINDAYGYDDYGIENKDGYGEQQHMHS